VEQNRGSGYEFTQLCQPYFDKGTKNIQWRKGSLSSTNVAGKSGYLPEENQIYIDVYHSVLMSTKNGSRTLISVCNSEVSTGKSREYSGSNRHRQGLPQ
jgi:hypothetical protein